MRSRTIRSSGPQLALFAAAGILSISILGASQAHAAPGGPLTHLQNSGSLLVEAQANRRDREESREERRRERREARRDNNREERQANRGENRQDAREDRRENRQEARSDRRENRQDARGDRRDNRQEQRADRRDNRQDNRADRREDRRDNRADRRETRRDSRSDRSHARGDWNEDTRRAASERRDEYREARHESRREDRSHRGNRGDRDRGGNRGGGHHGGGHHAGGHHGGGHHGGGHHGRRPRDHDHIDIDINVNWYIGHVNDGYHGSRWDDGWWYRSGHSYYGRERARGIILYNWNDYDGRYVHITDDIHNLRRTGFNNETTSIRVLSGVWEVCTGRNFNGYCIIVDSNVRNLRHSGFNNEISSVRRIDHRRHRGGNYYQSGYYGDHDRRDNYGVGVYAGHNYSGDYFQVGVDIEDFSIYAAGYDGSLEVLGGRWQVCEERHYRGRCTTVEGRYSDLGRHLGFAIGSIRTY